MDFLGGRESGVDRAATHPEAQRQFCQCSIRHLAFAVVGGGDIGNGQIHGRHRAALVGGRDYGGQRYIFLLGAIAGYFALTSHRIPPGRGVVYVAMFFMGTLTLMVSNAGVLDSFEPALAFLLLFPAESWQALSGGADAGRFSPLAGITMAALGALCFMLARHGLSGACSS